MSKRAVDYIAFECQDFNDRFRVTLGSLQSTAKHILYITKL